jgi:uncharacterized protein (DUF2141 family)
MRNKKLFLGVIFLTLLFFNCPPPPKEGRLEIISNPPGALVFIRGIKRGVTPLKLEGVPVGNYHLELRLLGYETVEEWIKVREGKLTSKSYTLEPLSGINFGAIKGEIEVEDGVDKSNFLIEVKCIEAMDVRINTEYLRRGIDTRRVFTDREGSFEIENLPIGAYIGYAWRDADNNGKINKGDYFGAFPSPKITYDSTLIMDHFFFINVIPGKVQETKPVLFKCAFRTGSISGKVVKEGTELGVSKAIIFVWKAFELEKGVLSIGVTDKNGNYLIKALPIGRYWLYAWKDENGDRSFTSGDLHGYPYFEHPDTGEKIISPTEVSKEETERCNFSLWSYSPNSE